MLRWSHAMVWLVRMCMFSLPPRSSLPLHHPSPDNCAPVICLDALTSQLVMVTSEIYRVNFRSAPATIVSCPPVKLTPAVKRPLASPGMHKKTWSQNLSTPISSTKSLTSNYERSLRMQSGRCMNETRTLCFNRIACSAKPWRNICSIAC